MSPDAYHIPAQNADNPRMIHCYSLLLLAALAPTCLGGTPRPNIVLILADDLGYETVGSFGGTSYATPAGPQPIASFRSVR